jgi:FAD/FMN-containing dehydrogenase
MKADGRMLNQAVAGHLPEDVLLDPSECGPFRRDWSGRDLGRPLAVARPRKTEHVSALMRAARYLGIPVVPSGGRTGLVRGTYAQDALVVTLDGLCGIRAIADDLTSATVEAGVTVARLRALAEERGARFPLSFGAEGSAQIGGVLATNAGGSTALRFGTARHLCLGLEVVLPDGEVLDTLSPVLKNNSGLDLKQLFIGAEGTLGIVTAATLRLVPAENDIATAVARVAGMDQAMALLSRVRRMAASGLDAFEFMSKSFVDRVAEHIRLPLADAGDFVLIELAFSAGSGPDARDLLERTLAAAFEAGEIDDAVMAASISQHRDFWAMRERSAEIAFATQPVVTTDICLPSTQLTAFAVEAEETLRRLDPDARSMTVGHLGDGNLHYTIWPGARDRETQRRLGDAIEALSVRLGGSFSAEHGVGLDKLDAMRRYKDPVALATMRRIKQAIDPDNLLNPGRLYPDLDEAPLPTAER